MFKVMVHLGTWKPLYISKRASASIESYRLGDSGERGFVDGYFVFDLARVKHASSDRPSLLVLVCDPVMVPDPLGFVAFLLERHREELEGAIRIQRSEDKDDAFARARAALASVDRLLENSDTSPSQPAGRPMPKKRRWTHRMLYAAAAALIVIAGLLYFGWVGMMASVRKERERAVEAAQAAVASAEGASGSAAAASQSASEAKIARDFFENGSGELDAFIKRIRALDERASALEGGLAALEGRQSPWMDRTGAMESDLAKLDGELSSLTERVSGDGEADEGLAGEVEQLAISARVIQEGLTAIDFAEISSVASRMRQLESDASADADRVEAVVVLLASAMGLPDDSSADQMTEAATELSRRLREFTSVSEQVQDLAERTEELQGRVAALRTGLGLSRVIDTLSPTSDSRFETSLEFEAEPVDTDGLLLVRYSVPSDSVEVRLESVTTANGDAVAQGTPVGLVLQNGRFAVVPVIHNTQGSSFLRVRLSIKGTRSDNIQMIAYWVPIR